MHRVHRRPEVACVSIAIAVFAFPSHAAANMVLPPGGFRQNLGGGDYGTGGILVAIGVWAAISAYVGLRELRRISNQGDGGGK